MDEKKKSKFLLTCKDFIDNTSCHGVGSWSRSTNVFQRFFWTLIVGGAMSYAIYQLRSLFATYLKYPHATSIEIYSENLKFPTVSICNINPIHNDMVNATERLAKLYEMLVAQASTTQEQEVS